MQMLADGHPARQDENEEARAEARLGLKAMLELTADAQN